MSSAGRPWTEEDDQMLRERYAFCLSVKDLAEEMGRKTQAIRIRAGKLGLKRGEAQRLEAFLESLASLSSEGVIRMALESRTELELAWTNRPQPTLQV